MNLSEGQINRIYDVLVEFCEASEDARERRLFVENQLKPKPPSEWRFIGALGFGGKFWRNNGVYVTCYKEDETPQRLKAIKKTNELLAEIAAS